MLNELARRSLIVVICAVTACTADRSSAAHEADQVCVPIGTAKALPQLPEASGLALSRRTAGRLWTLNDSGPPVIYALDSSGGVQGSVQITNATVEDWEDITAGPCAGGSCLYIADIGDNNTARRTITIYRLPEPQSAEAKTAPADALIARYPDGPHDAEAVFVTPDSRIFIITKEDAAGLYRFPQAGTGTQVTLEKVANLPMKRVTDADISADGNWVAVRSNEEVGFYRTSDLVVGKATGITASLAAAKEPQGEGIALAADGTLYLVSEGSGGGRFSTMRCRLGG